MNTKTEELVKETGASVFPVCNPEEAENARIIIQENLGGNPDLNQMDRIGVPSGRGGHFGVEFAGGAA